MIYAYIRVSTDKQTVENQKYEILKFADEKKIQVDQWLEETTSGTYKVETRKLGSLLKQMRKGDILIISELSRLGRPKGSYAKQTKLTGKESDIRELLKKEVSIAAIGRILGAHRLTVDSFIKKHQLRKPLNPMTNLP